MECTTIEQPRRAGAGHGDLASAFALALWAANKHPVFEYSYTPAPDHRPHLRGRGVGPLALDYVSFGLWPDDDDDD